MSFDWRAHEAEELERHFNPRVAVPEAAELLERYAARAAAARQALPGTYDMRYGPGEKQTFDLHPPARPADGKPLLVFIHGGYWRALDKSDHSFVVPAFTAAGATVVNLNYDLCPGVTLDDIVSQVRAGIAHVARNAADLGGNAARLYLMGHSAGAHLAAMLLRHDWAEDGLPADLIKGVAAVSGIYEPAVVLRIPVNAEIGLIPEQAARNDCLASPPLVSPPVLVSAGAAEPEGWIEQSRLYHAVCEASGAPATLTLVPGANHFTVLEAACDPAEPLCQEIVRLVTGG